MNLRDLAKMAGFSVSTVSKAFCDAGDVSRETKEKIFAVAKESGCFERYYKGRYGKHVIAIICPEIVSQRYASFVECM